MQDDATHEGVTQLLAQETKSLEIVALNTTGGLYFDSHNMAIIGFTDQIDLFIVSGSKMAERERNIAPRGLLQDFIHCEGLEKMAKLGQCGQISFGELCLGYAEQGGAKTAIDDVNFGGSVDASGQCPSIGIQAMDQEHGFEQTDEVANSRSIEADVIGHGCHVKDLAGLRDKVSQYVWQDIALAYLANIQNVTGNHHMHKIAEPAPTSRFRRSRQSNWEPASQDDSFVLGSGCRRWRRRDQLRGIGNQH